MKNRTEFLVDTDVLYEHLNKKVESGRSYLVHLMTKGLCFTTVLNAAELMLDAKTLRKTDSVKSLLSALKVLGIHPRYSLMIDKISTDIKNLRDALFLVTAQINKLDIITLNSGRYNSDKIKIFHPDQVLN